MILFIMIFEYSFKSLNMRRIFSLLIILIFLNFYNLNGQSIGWEVRTNNKEYLKASIGDFALRHRTDESENRVTFSKSVWKDKKVSLKIPIHYKIEKEIPSFQPRISFKMSDIELWAQTEFWIDESYDTAFAIEKSYNKYSFFAGWDTSEAFRFGLSYKLK